MEYIKTSDGQIHADFARRAGKLLLQYEETSTQRQPEDDCEATLTLCLLQALLTNCIEILNSKSKADGTGLRAIAGRSFYQEPILFGFNSGCITHQWAPGQQLEFRHVLGCIRNALSHPLPQNIGTYKTTGYTTWMSGSGNIEGFTFVQSPWVSRSGKTLQDRFKVDESNVAALQKTMDKWVSEYGTSNLAIRQIPKRLYQIYLGEEPFVPYLQLDFTTRQLRTLTLTLSPDGHP